MSKGQGSAREKLNSLSQNKAQLVELLLQQKAKKSSGITACPRQNDGAPARMLASWAQVRLWLIDQFEGGGAAYNVAMAVRLHGTLDEVACRRALDAIVQRHEVLRTVFRSIEGELWQEIAPDGRLDLLEVDLQGYDKAEREVEVQRHKHEEAQGHFDLSAGPLIRGRLLKLDAQEHVLLLTMHHIVFDAWSMGLLVAELAQLYAEYRDGMASTLAALPVQYADFAHWQRQSLKDHALQRQLDYWVARLGGVESHLELPTDWPRPAVQSYRGAHYEVVLDEALSADVRAFARRHGMTLFMALHAAWAMLLGRLSGQQDVLIGTPIANRQRPELQALIGFFVNTLVLRAEVHPDLAISEFLDQVKTATLSAYNNQDVPFEQVVEALQPQRLPNRNPLFQVMLVVQNAAEGQLRLPGLEVTPENAKSEHAKFDLLLSLQDTGGRIIGNVSYAADLFSGATIERWMACFAILLKELVDERGECIGDLAILAESERIALRSFNATQAPYSCNRLIHELFEDHAARTPDAAAVLYEDQVLTYSEVNGRANRLAARLRKLHIGPDDVVGICLERVPEMVVGLLGILKAGGAYMPLDPNYPAERLKYMLEDAAPQVVLCQEHLRALVSATSAEIIALDAEPVEFAAADEADFPAAAAGLMPHHLLYLIYTSGSTGRPKGTAMSHGSMVNLIEWQRDDLRETAGQRVLQFAALSFDVAFQEMFTTLCAGGTLVLVDEWLRKDAAALLQFLTSRGISRLFLPPMMLQSLAEQAAASDETPPYLHDVIAAGEQLRITPEIVRFFERVPECKLHNHYGPTETHVVTALTLPQEPRNWPALPSIGRPIANTQIHILDSRRRPLPIGVAGEIYIGGVGVARGYRGRPKLTADRFVADPFQVGSRARLYRTGDLGRWRADGTLEYLGRNDDQVKIRGHRVELGEIEARLALHPHIKEVAVVARDQGGDMHLVAYVAARNSGRLDIEDLRAQLRATLPLHMVPSAFVAMETLPLTPSGKLNRRALPAPRSDAFVSSKYDPPQGEIESVLASIWMQLLRMDRIGRQENFFDLGGHSLLAVKALHRINQACGTSLRVIDAYRNPTIRELAARIRGDASEDELVDLSKEASLDGWIDSVPQSRDALEHNILLTGATGFVGRYLLGQLLEDTSATIHCLIRARSMQQAQSRLQENLAQLGLWRDEHASRVVAVPCDLRLPRLGISEESYRLLSQSIDTVYHCATSMNHLETYAMAKPANVEAAKELVRFATQRKLKAINYISTLGIFSADAEGRGRSVDEHTSIDHERHSSTHGYAASKWVSEKVFMLADGRGVPCNIYRLGLAWGDTRQGLYDELQRGYRYLKSGLLSGYGIKDYRYDTLPIPVDDVAHAIVSLGAHHRSGGAIFHLTSSTQMTEGLFERCNRVAGTSLALVTMFEWIQKMKQLHQSGRTLPAVPLVEYAFAMSEDSFQEMQLRMRSARIHVRCERTQRELESAGIEISELDDALLKLSVERMLSFDEELQLHRM